MFCLEALVKTKQFQGCVVTLCSNCFVKCFNKENQVLLSAVILARKMLHELLNKIALAFDFMYKRMLSAIDAVTNSLLD